MADPGGGGGGLLFVDQTKGQRPPKNFLETRPPLSSQGLDDWAHPLYEGLDRPLKLT